MTEKSEFAKKWDKWLGTEEGKKCSDRKTLTDITDKYLVNRLYRAFTAGRDTNGDFLNMIEQCKKESPEGFKIVEGFANTAMSRATLFSALVDFATSKREV